jgi:hypothetical protein
MTVSLSSKRLVKEIAELCENFGLGIYSTANPALRTIHTGELPESVAEGIWLVEIPSPPPHDYIDTEYPVIDFWARSPHTPRAHALLEMVHNSFHRKYGYDTANWHIAFSRSLGSIVDVDRDAENGKLLRLSVQFICRNLNNIS